MNGAFTRSVEPDKKQGWQFVGKISSSAGQHTLHAQTSASESQERILTDLVNALLVEGLLDVGGRGELLDVPNSGTLSPHLLSFLQEHGLQRKNTVHVASTEAESALQTQTNNDSAFYFRWWVDRGNGRFLIFPVSAAVTQSYRYSSGDGVYEVDGTNQHLGADPTRLGAMELLERVTESLYGTQEQGQASNCSNEEDSSVARLKQLLLLSLEQTNWSDAYAAVTAAKAKIDSLNSESPWSLVEQERRAAFRDRPFHPVAKAKGGWTQADYEAFSAESGKPITLEWIAVQRDYVLSGSGSSKDNKPEGLPEVTPADLLLSLEDRSSVHNALERQGLSTEQYIALPVHPWQRSSMLPHMIRAELESGICVPLDVATGVYYATSSARSLAPQNGSNRHLKLPLGIVSLGAVRYLPAVHMMNGERGQRLLEQALALDPVLRERLSLCDEKSWWAYLPENGDYFAEPPRHLSALVRQYPAALTEAGNSRIVPMSALAVHTTDGTDPILDIWIRERGLSPSAESATQLFKEVCLQFFTICLRLFRLGVMPEIHGQNVVLTLKDGMITGMLLRDHDSIRLHVPWMDQHGLDDPHYKMKPGYPNSLYNETPQKLLLYLQTLGIQVNLYSILEAIASLYSMDEKQLWQVLKDSLYQAIELAELTGAVKELVVTSLFEKPIWPWKNLIKPLLEQEGTVTGSMPSGMGETVNPFHRF
jgi:siderophore synthetase component